MLSSTSCSDQLRSQCPRGEIIVLGDDDGECLGVDDPVDAVEDQEHWGGDPECPGIYVIT